MYLREENRVLKEALRGATGKSRIALTVEQRRRLAAKGKALTPAEREECCQIVRDPSSGAIVCPMSSVEQARAQPAEGAALSCQRFASRSSVSASGQDKLKLAASVRSIRTCSSGGFPRHIVRK